MDSLTLESRAKINLSLFVLGKRPDGYHTIESVMQTVDFGDRVTIELADAPGIQLETNRPDLPAGEGNIAYRAAALLQKTFDLHHGFFIHLDKRIPVAAGLAGGSGNAAAVLQGINQLCGLGLSDKELAALGLTLGADVPFCLYGRPALATGIGERLTPVAGLSDCYIVLTNPGVSVSTALIYQVLDSGNLPAAGHTDRLVKALEQGCMNEAFAEMKNVMEPAAIQYCPAIAVLLDRLRSSGAAHAMMSGSGATCFGVFPDRPDMETLRQTFGDQLVAVARPIP